MARLFTCGYETTPGTTDELSYSFEGRATGTVTRDTTVKRSGDASRKCDSGAGNATALSFHTWVNQDLGAGLGVGWYFRIYFQVATLPSANSVIQRFGTSATATVCGARLNTTGTVSLVDSALAQVGSPSTEVVALNEWYCLELYGKVASGANDEGALRLNGELVASTTGQTWSETAIDRGYTGWQVAPGANRVIYVDDMALNDDEDATNNSWPGEGSIIYLNPTADSAVGGSWTAGAGATTDLFDAVDNDPPSGVAAASATNTSQIKNENAGDTTGNYDVTMQTYDAAGLPAASDITIVQPVVTHGRDGANTAGAMQLVSNPAGAEELFNWGRGANIGTYPSAWTTRWGNDSAVYNPTVSTSTAPVVRVGKRNAAVSPHICGIRVAVEYLPSDTTQVMVPVRGIGMGRW